MPLIQYVCKNVALKKCIGAPIQDDKMPPPNYCISCKGSIDRTQYVEIEASEWDLSSDSDSGMDSDDEFVVADPKEPRPTWFKGRREEITKRQTKNGKIMCGICKKAIKVNSTGEEEWTSKSGNFHKTKPHIDHFGGKIIPLSVTDGVSGVTGDFAERMGRLRSNIAHQSKKIQKRKEIERDVFNASPLRITHMKCNCSRSKYKQY